MKTQPEKRVFRSRRRIAAAVCLALLCAEASIAIAAPPPPIPQGDTSGIKKFQGHKARAHRLRTFRVPRHPYMAPNGRSNIHGDAYMTDTHRTKGVLGNKTKVTSALEGAECASIAFDKVGRLVTVCVGLERPRLLLLGPKTLESKAEFPLPPRSGGGTGTSPFNDFSGGGYFYLDQRDRAVIPTNNREIWVVGKARGPTGVTLELKRRYDLSLVIPPGEGIVSVLPDWHGRYWFVTTKGRVGTVMRKSGNIHSLQLKNQVIANSFAADKTGGVYIVSDHALFRFDANKKGEPKITWKRKYDRGKRMKPGQVSQGSGTTPTLIGRRYVAITDNADPRMHVRVYKRKRHIKHARLVCSEGVFRKRKSASDNSLIAVGRSLIVENNYGYSGPAAVENGQSTTPGIARVRFGRKKCDTVWRSKETSPSVVPKVSLRAGLLYLYTKKPRQDGKDVWYLTALRYATGKLAFRRFSGEGLGYNNNYAPITVGPDGSVYVGVLGGLVKFKDKG